MSTPASAEGDSDFETTPLTLTFPSGAMDGDSLCGNVSIIDDSALEGEETFTVTLDVTDGSATVGNNATTIHISDDDG